MYVRIGHANKYEFFALKIDLKCVVSQNFYNNLKTDFITIRKHYYIDFT